MPGVRDVRAEDFITAYSSHLKRSGALASSFEGITHGAYGSENGSNGGQEGRDS